MIEYKGVNFNLDFRRGNGDVRLLPNCPGIYAQVHWPTRCLRIGESATIRSHNLKHIRWADKHRLGSHSAKEAERKGPIVDLVKEWGSEGLEHYVVSVDPRLADRVFRVDCEKFLHRWAQTQTDYVNINNQRSYRTVN